MKFECYLQTSNRNILPIYTIFFDFSYLLSLYWFFGNKSSKCNVFNQDAVLPLINRMAIVRHSTLRTVYIAPSQGNPLSLHSSPKLVKTSFNANQKGEI